MKDKKVINFMDLISIEKKVVVQSNSIVDGVYKITLNEARVINLAISKIKKHDPPGSPVRITHAEFTNTWKIKDNNLKRRLSDIGDELIQRTIDTISIDKSTGKKIKIRRTWISKIEYNMDNIDQYLEITFSQDVERFIYQLKNNFTMFEIENVSNFTSPYSFRIYAWIYKYINFVSHVKNGLHFTDQIKIDDFKEMMGISNNYEKYKYLKSGVIEKAIKEINNYSDLSVILEEFRIGRSVKQIRFVFVREKNTIFSNEENKPKRARSPSRPKVKVGTHLEGEWARRCIDIIEKYEKDIRNYDATMVLPISDLEKLINYYQILGDKQKVSELSKKLEARRN
ncbi:plasmid replication protein [Candidatus Regiella insecticola LSR1]|uniref:Plasmid replication protein n=1 Tax=Candidatus Regiella insecticola LSR1 TaxID=663321 RepID=E0WUJ6_9ENTR|nr:replication initiation protein [Candidatus Regiella insecticola]EFL91321.1 plasmid replication protein [Candidatus Regiella insecticola LSR1]